MKFILMILVRIFKFKLFTGSGCHILKIDKSFVDALEYKNVTSDIIEMARL